MARFPSPRGQSRVIPANGAAWTPVWLGASGLTGLQTIALGPCVFGGWDICNFLAGPCYIQLFDASSIADITLGKTAPFYGFPLSQVNGTAANGTSANVEQTLGVGPFQKGIIAVATTTDGGATAVGTGVSGFFKYRLIRQGA